MIHIEDKSLALPNGRTLAYADNGNTSSSSVVLFLHGAFSVGDASRLPHVLIEKKCPFCSSVPALWNSNRPSACFITCTRYMRRLPYLRYRAYPQRAQPLVTNDLYRTNSPV